MENLAISKISSKGQLLIPKNFRKYFKCGDRVLLFEKNNKIIIDKEKNLIKKYKEELEDLEFYKNTEKAMKEIKKGNYKEMDVDKFIKHLDNL